MTDSDAGLYDKSLRAAKRRHQWQSAPETEMERALRATELESFRVGWMMGYRAGALFGLKRKSR